MLPFDDPRWEELKGGYGLPYNPVSALKKLERGVQMKEVWEELWNELHHQGDVGEASYAAVPQLVRIQKEKRELDWNLYALVSTIELGRHRTTNPRLPSWLAEEYSNAWSDLVTLAIEALKEATDWTTVQALLGTVALGKGFPKIGAVICDFTEDELAEILNEYQGWSDLSP